MLVLSRFIEETILIGDDIEIKVLDVSRGSIPKVRIGVTAPQRIAVHRKEVKERIERDRREREQTR